MAWFRCFVNGENFPGEMAASRGLVGFFVTRFIEAEDAEDAESRALDHLRDDLRLKRPRDFQPTGREIVTFDRIEEIPSIQMPAKQPGFVWYPMTGASDDGKAC